MNELVKTPGQFSTELRSRMRKKLGKPEQPAALLLDTSGSMAGEPIKQLRKLAEGFRSIRRFVFSDICYEMDTSEAVGDAAGGTNMAKAFAHVKTVGVDHIVLITDGQPDSESDALRESAGLKIDILYVGPPPAPPFLERLANNSGGKYGAASLDDTQRLESSIKGLLPAAVDTTIKL